MSTDSRGILMRRTQSILAIIAALTAVAFPGTAASARSADDPIGGAWNGPDTCPRGAVCLYHGTDGRHRYRTISHLPADCSRVPIDPRSTRSTWNNNPFPVRFRMQGGGYLDLGADTRRGDLRPPRYFTWVARNTCFVPPT
ncbi:hypothetical protein [Cryptosporangium sp. NPDC051539]|uniref:hypothetical protein n=1 Tax=Cryptosporangium sp. NPDC051539 TaxID=3363962 RepID=UPI0037992F0D